jgi:hypothetical protein
METILIEIKNNKALSILRVLEDLHIIRLLKKGVTSEMGTYAAESAAEYGTTKKVSDYKGILSSELADKMNAHVKQSREEWGRI